MHEALIVAPTTAAILDAGRGPFWLAGRENVSDRPSPWVDDSLSVLAANDGAMPCDRGYTLPVSQHVVVLGGGLSGCAAAYALAREGFRVTVVERAGALGGLAGSFERGGRFYPLGYHHILRSDRTLLYFLEQIGARDRVRWRRISMLFRQGNRNYDLAKPAHFLKFPLSLVDKTRFACMMLRAYTKSDWDDWRDRSAEELIDAWAGPTVRKALFEPLTRLKFDLPCSEVSAAWLGVRLNHREGSAPLGYMPDTNWTTVLCNGMAGLLDQSSVDVRLKATATRLGSPDAERISEIELESGERLQADVVVSTVPTEVYLGLVPDDNTPTLRDITYSALLSMVCASKRAVDPDFYWMNLADLNHAACGIFQLNALNPTIGAPGDSCINFVTHLNSRDDPFFLKPDEEIRAAYLNDFRSIFGFDLDPCWTKLTRVPMYSPVVNREYRNPPARSSRFRNLYFAGNYRTFPSVLSTGTALASGLQSAQTVMADLGAKSPLLDAAVSLGE